MRSLFYTSKTGQQGRHNHFSKHGLSDSLPLIQPLCCVLRLYSTQHLQMKHTILILGHLVVEEMAQVTGGGVKFFADAWFIVEIRTKSKLKSPKHSRCIVKTHVGSIVTGVAVTYSRSQTTTAIRTGNSFTTILYLKEIVDIKTHSARFQFDTSEKSVSIMTMLTEWGRKRLRHVEKLSDFQFYGNREYSEAEHVQETSFEILMVVSQRKDPAMIPPSKYHTETVS